MSRHVTKGRRLIRFGVAGLIAGSILIATTTVANAAGPKISVSPSTDVVAGQTLAVTGAGFWGRTHGAIFECNLTPGEPTIEVSVGHKSRPVPVGCTHPQPVRTTRGGDLRATQFVVKTGITGIPASGIDSAGNDAAVDAASYPCPPSPSQIESSCVIELLVGKHQVASQALTFVPPTTTCLPTSVSATGTGSAAVSLYPGSCLQDGTTTLVGATGLAASTIGALTECNVTPGEPTVFVQNGGAVPVGCTSPLSNVFSGTPQGTMSRDFTVADGTIGPPATGTDSHGNSAAADATNYPCPPTPAQIASGSTCDVILADVSGDQVSVPITFAPM